MRPAAQLLLFDRDAPPARPGRRNSGEAPGGGQVGLLPPGLH